MIYDEPKQWALVFWVYRTSKRISTQATPFLLVYGAKGTISLSRLALSSLVTDLREQIHDIEAFKETKSRG